MKIKTLKKYAGGMALLTLLGLLPASCIKDDTAAVKETTLTLTGDDADADFLHSCVWGSGDYRTGICQRTHADTACDTDRNRRYDTL